MQHSGPPHIAALTSTRGLAAWWVALYHFREYLPVRWDSTLGQFIGGGYYAVDLFFVLSGFVLHINYGDRFIQFTGSALREFAVARFARVYPLHFFMLMVYPLIPLAIILFSQYGLPGQRYTLEYYVLSLFLVQNWGFVDYMGWNVPAWSISTEFAAYIIFPLAAALIMRVRRSGLAIGLLVLVLAATAYLFWASGRVNIMQDIERWGLIRCLVEFLIGMCLGRIYQLSGAPGFPVQIGLLLAAALLLALMLMGVVKDFFVLPTMLALIVLALTARSGPLMAVMGWRALVYLGEISYATYLVHYFLREAIKFVMPSAWGPSWAASTSFIFLTLLASVILYHVIELPARRALRARAGGGSFVRAGPADPSVGRQAQAWGRGKAKARESTGHD